MQTVLEIIIYAGIIQGFYMALLLKHNKRQNVANTYLSFLLVVLSISIAHSEFMVSEIHKSFNNPYWIKEPFLMLIIPLIWMYVKKLEQPLFRFKLKTTLHFLPFAVFMSLSIPAFIGGANSAWTQSLIDHSSFFNITIWAVLLVQYSVYLMQMAKLIHQYKTKAEQELSNTEKVDLSWLKTFMYAFILVFAMLAIMFVGAIHKLDTSWMNKAISLIFSLTIFILGYKGIFQQSIFSNADLMEPPEMGSLEINKTRPIDDHLKIRVLDYMENNKPYCEPELTLTSLAEQLKIGRNQLSEIINNSMGCNFYDFVNRYRVEEVKHRLTLTSSKNFTLLAIAFDSGFPSKSTFNTIFKKITGLTPSEYRKGLK